MKIICLTSALLLSLAVYAQSTYFVKSFNYSSPDALWQSDIVQMKNGSFLSICGSILIKYNSKGEIVWSKKYSCSYGTVHPYFGTITADSARIVILAMAGNQNASIVELDTAGNPVWMKIISDVQKGYLYCVKEIPGVGFLMAGVGYMQDLCTVVLK